MKISKRWQARLDSFPDIVKKSNCYADVCRNLNLRENGSNPETIKKYIKHLNLDISHFDAKAIIVSKLTSSKGAKPLEEILVKNSKCYNSHNLKKRLLKEELLKNQCSECKLEVIWQGKPISLHLEHINGEHSDNRLENLTILCPNCHSQTLTYGNKKR